MPKPASTADARTIAGWPRAGLITYDGLPISSGGAHTIRTRGVTDGVAAVRGFLSACTTNPDPEFLHVEVSQGGSLPPSLSKSLRKEFRHLGWWPIKSRIGSTVTRKWRLPLAEFEAACAVLERHRPLPQSKDGWPAAFVGASWRFAFIDAETGQVLPHQGPDAYVEERPSSMRRIGESTLYARFSEKTTVSVFLALPFEDAGEDARRFVGTLQDHFPTRFSSKHWRLWRLNKAATGYYGRKISGLPP